MCVASHARHWERPATLIDVSVLAEHFTGIDFQSLLNTMSQDYARPLTTDLALVGAMIHTQPDDLGMCFVPFSAITETPGMVVKLPVMESVVDWFENSALGTDMWQHASDWCEARDKSRFHFAMNCGCGRVSKIAKENGNWSKWQQRFNLQRSATFGRTNIVYRSENSIDGLDMTQAQLDMWFRIRTALEAMPAV